MFSAMSSSQTCLNREMDSKNMRGKSGGVHNFFNYIHLLNTNFIELLCVQRDIGHSKSNKQINKQINPILARLIIYKRWTIYGALPELCMLGRANTESQHTAESPKPVQETQGSLPEKMTFMLSSGN